MEETIYDILTDESAREIDVVAESLETPPIIGAPWYTKLIEPEHQ